MIAPRQGFAVLAVLVALVAAWFGCRLGMVAVLPAVEAQPLTVAAPVPVPTQPPGYGFRRAIFTPVTARHAMVASDHALATEVGVTILRQGGNAIDAAVAVGFSLAVVQPYAGNLGGGGFMLLRAVDALANDPQRATDIALDFRETAPAAAHRDMYLDANGELLRGRSLFTHHAIGVPGTVAGLIEAQQRYGTLPLARLIAPAIALAEDGFTVSPVLAEMLHHNRDMLGRWPSTRAIFFRADGAPLAAGDTLIQRDLAATLRTIARDGAAGFYGGPVAERIVAEIAAHGGPMTLADLAAYRAVWRAPVVGHYRGFRIAAMPPPSSGGVHVVQMLNLLERYPMTDYGAGSAQALHLMAEAMKLAYADRSVWLGDPDFVPVPVAALTSRAYADTLAAQIDPLRARASSEIRPGQPLPDESHDTTHYSVVDAHGNVASVTYTLNLNFGSGIVAAGTGVLLNNEMDDFSARPGVPNAFGLVGGQANAIAPGKRPLSSMTPVIVYRDAEPWLVTGSPGGARIISTVLQAIVNAVDFGLNPMASAAMPRIHHQWLPDVLQVEAGFSPDTLRLLTDMGHKVRVTGVMGRTQTIQIDARRDGDDPTKTRLHGDGQTRTRLYGASDPRNPDGLTAGY